MLHKVEIQLKESNNDKYWFSILFNNIDKPIPIVIKAKYLIIDTLFLIDSNNVWFFQNKNPSICKGIQVNKDIKKVQYKLCL